ncbi:DUF6160 family protein [Pseudomonas sp. M30-35]|uniref:DUF6160 family protein n=1 Tax=Pseudomonas sp. M30-35 TaxID=1981174 RepID=UPI000B3C9D2C|nr:DUF6160 family protein [Pseudomonas sp. M30-35]ARU87452.1 hypothetical protein B9K09_05465 [Pseudomonas sp. M30-35]
MYRYSMGLIGLFSSVLQAMQALDDNDLSAVTGQDGISIQTSGPGWSVSSIDYAQDGQTLSLKNVSSRPQSANAASNTTIDVLGGQLQVEHKGRANELSVGKVEIAGNPNNFGSLRMFSTLGASLKLRGGGASGVSGFSIDDSKLSLTDTTFYYRDNGLDLVVKGVSFDTFLNNAYIDIVSGGNGEQVKLDLGDTRFVASVAGIGLDLAHSDAVAGNPATPSAPDSRDPQSGRSFGQLNMDLRLGGSISIAGGGQSGEGLRLIPDITIANSLFQYTDSGVLRAENYSGVVASQSGLTLDFEQDAQGSYVKLAFEDLNLAAELQGLIIGDPASQRVGSVGFDLSFQNQGGYENYLKLRPGGDTNSGSEGITADVSWSLADGALSLTDNGNSLWFSGLRSYGTGQVAVDITKSCATGLAAGCYSGLNDLDPSSGSYDGYFDGIRFGLNNVVGRYSLDGIRVGKPDAPLQGGSELLVLLAIFPAYDFTLNGQLTIKPGGFVGDGFGFNADFYTTEANAAITVDENSQGLWLSGAEYEMHYRDGSVDVSNQGVEFRKGTYWSKLDVSDLRLGDKDTGRSVGRIVLKRYERDSLLALSSGGAGALCVGGTGASAGACSASGGRWDDRGNEGLSAKLKSVFVRDNSGSPENAVSNNDKRNQFILENGRVNNVNGSGSQWVIDNFYTSDGDPANPDQNTYGFNVDLGLDVAPSSVCIKNSTGCTPITPDPLGFAVNARAHFKEINIERFQNVHPTGGSVTSFYGVKLQNADIRANLTATPIN